MTDKERNEQWAEVAAILNPQPAQPLAPIPSNAPPGLSGTQREVLHDNWVASIYARPQNTWLPDEIEAVRFSANRALKALGY
jgi:hypothetical protein